MSLDTKHILRTSPDETSYIYFGEHIVAMFDILYGAPMSTASYHKVKVKKKKMLNGCIDEFKFDKGRHGSSHWIVQK
jgi:hypothetical protein